MSEAQGDEPNLRYGFIPENIFQNLLSIDFTIRLDAAQLLSKSMASFSTSEACDTSKIDFASFFEFSKSFLIDENFGVINCFSEILDNLFSCSDKNTLQEYINESINMLLPPLQDKRSAVRSISSNLVIKYSKILESTELLEHLISIFYDQSTNSQLEILNIAHKSLSISEINVDDSSFAPKLSSLIENAFLIVNVNIHVAATRLLQTIQQNKPEIYKIIPDEIKKASENQKMYRISTSRLPQTPTSALPPIYPSFSNAMKQKISQIKQPSPSAPDTASSKKRTDEFWYRSKPRFAKTAGFIIGKGGLIALAPSSSQQYASTATIPQISKNSFSRTADSAFQRQDSCGDDISNQYEQMHIYEQAYESINQNDNTQNNEYDEKESEINNENEYRLNYSNNHSKTSSNNYNDDFNEFDSMPAPRVSNDNKKKLNKASLINMNEQADLGIEEKFKQSENDTHSISDSNQSKSAPKRPQNFDDTPLQAKEPHIVFDDSEASPPPPVQPPPSSRPRRQFKPRPPSLPPTQPPPLYHAPSEDDGFDSQTAGQPPQEALKIKKLKYSPGGASIRAKHSVTATTAQTAKPKNTSPKSEKPDLQSIVSDLQASNDWERQNASLLTITSLITSSPLFVTSNIRAIVFEVTSLCSSIRSALAKTALECLTSLASSFGPEMNPFFESVVNDLLMILLSSKSFITRLASGCISTILHGVARKKAVDYLTGDHRKRPGPCKATLAMCLEELVGNEEDEPGDASVEVVKAVGMFITDANPEARKHARAAIKKIAGKNKNLASLVATMELDKSEKKVIMDAIEK